MSSFRNYLPTNTSNLSEDEVEGAAKSLIILLTPYSEDPSKGLNRMPRDLVTCLTKTNGTAVSTVDKAKGRILDSDLNTANLQSGTFRTNCHTGRLHMTRMAAEYLMAQSKKEGSQAQTISEQVLLGLKEYSLSADRTIRGTDVAMKTEVTTPQRKTKLSKTDIMIPPSQVVNMEAFIQQAPEECFGPLDHNGSSPRTAMSTKMKRYFSVGGERSGVMYTKSPSVALKAVRNSNYMPWTLARQNGSTVPETRSDAVKQVFGHISADALRTHILRDGSTYLLDEESHSTLSKAMLAKCDWDDSKPKRPLLKNSVWINRATVDTETGEETFQCGTVDGAGRSLAVRPMSREEVTAVLEQW
jgi:hypothetical protein